MSRLPRSMRVVKRIDRPAVEEPRAPLLEGVLRFTRTVRDHDGVSRVALLGSLTTEKPWPKDADLLVTVSHDVDLDSLARAGRRLKGFAQGLNRGADIFLADDAGAYLGRICSWRECKPRVLCGSQRCGRRQHLNEDFETVTLEPDLIREPPVELWPRIVRRVSVPADVEAVLLATLEKDQARPNGRA